MAWGLRWLMGREMVVPVGKGEGLVTVVDRGEG